MKLTIDDIIKERKDCCEKVQGIVDKYSTASLTSLRLRNLLQIELKDKIKPTNELTFYKEFAEQYELCDTVEEIKQALVDNLR